LFNNVEGVTAHPMMASDGQDRQQDRGGHGMKEKTLFEKEGETGLKTG
jgi:hypothetical protein